MSAPGCGEGSLRGLARRVTGEKFLRPFQPNRGEIVCVCVSPKRFTPYFPMLAALELHSHRKLLFSGPC